MFLCKQDICHDSCHKALCILCLCSDKFFFCILDPQNEFKEIVEKYGGSYFDLTPKSKIYINGFEVSDELFYADKDTKEKFIATQTKYAKSLDKHRLTRTRVSNNDCMRVHQQFPVSEYQSF